MPERDEPETDIADLVEQLAPAEIADVAVPHRPIRSGLGNRPAVKNGSSATVAGQSADRPFDARDDRPNIVRTLEPI